MKKINFFLMASTIFLFGSTLLSCEKEDVQKWETTSVSYMLTMSPDLLKFVYPEVTYVDSQGEVHTISGVHDLDSLVNVTYTYVPGNGVWTIQTIEGTNYKAWTLNMSFKHPFYSYFGVKYKRLDFVEGISEDKVYDFHHSIFSTTVYATSHITTTTKVNWLGRVSTEFGFGSGALVENHISFTKNSNYSGQEVEDYINELVNTPDKAGYFINEGGKFTKNNDFEL